MPFLLLPEYMTPAVFSLPPVFFKTRDIHLVLLDFDNTLLPYTSNSPSYAVIDWIRAMQEAQIQLCVVSNSRKCRARRFCNQYGIGCITHAKKPFGKGISRAIHRYRLPREQVALIGDQIFTDVLGANLQHVHSILVQPIRNHNIWLKLRHLAEKPFIYFARRRRV